MPAHARQGAAATDRISNKHDAIVLKKCSARGWNMGVIQDRSDQMSILSHRGLPFHEVPRIKTRVLASGQYGAEATAVWEQWIEPDGYIPLHYHETEEVLLILDGDLSLTVDNATSLLSGPATIVVPARQLHGLRPCDGSRVHLLAIFPTAQPTIFAPDGSLRPLPWEDFGDSERRPK